MNRASFAFDLIEKMNRADSPEGLLAHLATGCIRRSELRLASIPGGLKDFDVTGGFTLLVRNCLLFCFIPIKVEMETKKFQIDGEEVTMTCEPVEAEH